MCAESPGPGPGAEAAPGRGCRSDGTVPIPSAPRRLSPPLCRVPGDVRMLGKEEAEEEGKGAQLPPPPVGDGPLAGAQGRGGGARDEFAALPPDPSAPAGAAPCGSRQDLCRGGRAGSMDPEAAAGRRGAAGRLLLLLVAASLLRLRAAGKDRHP